MSNNRTKTSINKLTSIHQKMDLSNQTTIQTQGARMPLWDAPNHTRPLQSNCSRTSLALRRTARRARAAGTWAARTRASPPSQPARRPPAGSSARGAPDAPAEAPAASARGRPASASGAGSWATASAGPGARPAGAAGSWSVVRHTAVGRRREGR